jgi:hypothetical protein
MAALILSELFEARMSMLAQSNLLFQELGGRGRGISTAVGAARYPQADSEGSC